jgi:hypothetical protein
MENRDREMGMPLIRKHPRRLIYWTALTKVRVTSFLLSATATFIVGLFGFGGSGVWRNDVTWLRNATVFAAAPLSSTRSAFNVHPSQLYAPPAYEMTSASMTQAAQFIPSIGCRLTLPAIRKFETTRGGSWGTFGSAPSTMMPTDGVFCGGLAAAGGDPAPGDCAKVTVWLPKNSDPSKSPTTNDPAAKVTLDIVHPPSGSAGNCVIWYYRYGEAPPKPKQPLHPKRKPVSEGKADVISQSSLAGSTLLCHWK